MSDRVAISQPGGGVRRAISGGAVGMVPDVANDGKWLRTVVTGGTAAFVWQPIDHSDVAGLGDAALLDVGQAAGTVAAGDDSRFTSASDAMPTRAGTRDGEVVFNQHPEAGEAFGWIWSERLYEWQVMGQLAAATSPLAPQHPVAVQGPTDPANLYALITWDRNDPAATGYRVYRDGVQIATTTDAGAADDWDKRYYKDTGVTAHTTHSYQVAAVSGSTVGLKSRPCQLHIRASSPAKTFDVTTMSGADIRAQLANALTAARASSPTWTSPAVVLFPAGTYAFTAAELSSTLVAGDRNIIIRGAAKTTTILRAAYAGSTSEAGTDKIVIRWGGTTSAISGLNPTVAVARASRQVTLEAGHPFVAGDKIWLSEIASTNATALDLTDSYDAWDCNIVESVAGQVVTVRYPWAKPFTVSATVGRLDISGCGIEQLTVEGQSNTETGYYTLLAVEHAANHTIAECRFRYFNRNAIYLRGYRNRVVACDFTLTDPRVHAGESQRYMISSGRGMGLVVCGCVFGDLDRASSSMITNSVSHKQVVRHNQFRRSVNYGWNSHGAADYWDVIENNYFLMPEASKGGVFLGNSSFVYAGPTRIRGNLFDQCATACVACQQNSYQMILNDNWFRDAIDDLVNWYGAALPTMAPATYGSARSAISRNQCDYTTAAKANRGFVIGQSLSPTPFAGVRDLLIRANEIDVDADAIKIGGTAAESYNLQVYQNTGNSDYTRPPLVAGDYWNGNADSVPVSGSGTDATPFFADTFSGAVGASAGWPIYLRSTTTGTGIGFLVSSTGNYGRLSTTTAVSGGRKVVCALRSEQTTDSLQVCDFRNAFLTTSRKQCLVARHKGTAANDDRYQAVYEYGTGVTNRVRLEKVVAGVVTVIAQTTSLDASLTADMRIRFEVAGTTIRLNAWLTTGSEPGGWLLTATDTEITENGKAGVLLDAVDATTVIADYDNYKLVNWTRAAQADYGTLVPPDWNIGLWDWETVDGVAELA